ncbi:putative EpsG-like glucosyltransferase [Vibrio crassostreae]|nr:EpsG-like putative glucosyltransferase [Vibrio crassostreae]CAK2409514.1 putative EpsG-like glucosyltransferase [Vibrio crassostreae]CAK2414317.1 putative EpsG-like glucosyltransferase [Vibrio crassostreae]CAK3610285.1 putative EpsG-like glucosyltransferase [Vibrio crassostreae]CAK3796451.1 putative EpsG-like glucosyltransferase [Vibrio crassostreae]
MIWSIFICIAILLSLLDVTFKNKITMFLFTIFFLLLGFRDQLGWDFDTYVKYYEDFDYYYMEQSRLNEIGFIFLLSILNSIGASAQAQFLLATTIKVFTYIYILGKEKYRTLSLLLYLAIPFLAIRDFSNIRQTFGECIFLLSLYFAGKYGKKLLVFNSISVIFHTASLLSMIYAPFLWVHRLKKSTLVIISVFISLFGYVMPFVLSKFVSGLTFFPIFNKLIIYTVATDIPKLVNTTGTLKGTLILYVFIWVSLMIMIRFKDCLIYRENRFFYSSFIIGSWMYFMCANLPYPIARIAYYGLASMPILLVMVLSSFKVNKFHKQCILAFIICSLFMFYGQLIYKANTSNSIESQENKALRFNFELIQ